MTSCKIKPAMVEKMEQSRNRSMVMDGGRQGEAMVSGGHLAIPLTLEQREWKGDSVIEVLQMQ